jgi:hypothetical protein
VLKLTPDKVAAEPDPAAGTVRTRVFFTPDPPRPGAEFGSPHYYTEVVHPAQDNVADPGESVPLRTHHEGDLMYFDLCPRPFVDAGWRVPWWEFNIDRDGGFERDIAITHSFDGLDNLIVWETRDQKPRTLTQEDQGDYVLHTANYEDGTYCKLRLRKPHAPEPASPVVVSQETFMVPHRTCRPDWWNNENEIGGLAKLTVVRYSDQSQTMYLRPPCESVPCIPSPQ